MLIYYISMAYVIKITNFLKDIYKNIYIKIDKRDSILEK